MGTAATDEELLIQQDAASFELFYDRYFMRLLAFFSRRTPDAELAADLTAETFAAALAARRVDRIDRLPFEPNLIVLTAVELFNIHGPPMCWQEAGGRAAELGEVRGYRRPLIPNWADITTQLHLDVPPHGAWVDQEIDRLNPGLKTAAQAAVSPVDAES